MQKKRCPVNLTLRNTGINVPESSHFAHTHTHTTLELLGMRVPQSEGTALKHVIALTKPQIRGGWQEAVDEELVVCWRMHHKLVCRMLTYAPQAQPYANVCWHMLMSAGGRACGRDRRADDYLEDVDWSGDVFPYYSDILTNTIMTQHTSVYVSIRQHTSAYPAYDNMMTQMTVCDTRMSVHVVLSKRRHAGACVLGARWSWARVSIQRLPGRIRCRLCVALKIAALF